MNENKWSQYGKKRLLERNRLICEHHEEAIKTFIKFFECVDINSKILDIGCGGGFFLELLRNLGFKNIQGIDLADPFLERAFAKNLSVKKQSIYDISYQKEFDYILCIEIFEHLESIPYEKIRQALKPDGILYVTVPVYDAVLQKWERIWHNRRKIDQAKGHDPTHIRAYSKDILCKETISAGFRILLTKHCFNPTPLTNVRSVWRILGKIWDKGMFFVGVFQK